MHLLQIINIFQNEVDNVALKILECCIKEFNNEFLDRWIDDLRIHKMKSQLLFNFVGDRQKVISKTYVLKEAKFLNVFQ